MVVEGIKDSDVIEAIKSYRKHGFSEEKIMDYLSNMVPAEQFERCINSEELTK